MCFCMLINSFLTVGRACLRLQREDVVQAELLASPAPGKPAIILSDASLSWEAGDLQKTVLRDITLQVACVPVC